MQINNTERYNINAVYNRIINYERIHFLDDYDDDALKDEGPFFT